MTQSLRNINDGKVSISFNLNSQDSRGIKIETKVKLSFSYDVYLTGNQTYYVKLAKVEPDDPRAMARFLLDESACQLLESRIKEKMQQEIGGPIIIERFEKL